MKNCRNLLFLLLLAACSGDPRPQTTDVITVEPKSPVQAGKTDYDAVKEAAVPNSGLDTATALFLYKNYKNFNPDSQFIHYTRWDLHHEKIKPILVNLYLNGPHKDEVLNTLERNRQAFHDKAVTSVLDGYRNKNGVLGMWFAYLVEKEDEVVLPLLQDLLKNPKASSQDKEYALKVLQNWKGRERAGK